MRITSLFLTLLYSILLSLLFQNSLFAADYTWNVRSQNTGTADIVKGASSASSACDNAAIYETSATRAYPGVFTVVSISKVSDTLFTCVLHYKRNNSSVNANSNYSVVRYGESCPSSYIYNAQTGSCDGDPCLPTAGQIVISEHSFRTLTAEGNPDIDPPVSICSDKCQYTHTFNPFTAQRDGKRPDQMLGKFEYKGNGMSCTGGSGGSNFDQPASKPPMSPEPVSIKDSDCSQWTTNANGVSSRSCLTTDYFNEPGLVKCTTGGGSMTCAVSTPAPYSKDTSKNETTTKTTNADGSTKTDTSSTTTTTTCKGVKPCSTTGKTETSTTGTNADGTPGDTTETCTGKACSEDNGSEAEGEEEGEEEGEGESPTFTPIAKPADTGSFEDANADWDQKIAEAKDDIKDKVQRLGDEFAGGVSLGSGGGSLYCGDSVEVLGQQIKMCLSDYSQQLSLFSYMVLFMGALIALYIVFK
ncbi:MAG: hypothetical protein ACRCTL_12115 [Pseudomonas sp.]